MIVIRLWSNDEKKLIMQVICFILAFSAFVFIMFVGINSDKRIEKENCKIQNKIAQENFDAGYKAGQIDALNNV